MTNLDDPKWARAAQRHGFTWAQMTPRDKANFIAVTEYNRERQQVIDSDQDIVKFTARIAEANQVSDMLLNRLQEMKDAACAHLISVEARELAIVSALNLPLDPPRLVQNPNTGDYDVMFNDTSYLHLTAKEALTDEGREKIKQTLTELETKRNDTTTDQDA